MAEEMEGRVKVFKLKQKANGQTTMMKNERTKAYLRINHFELHIVNMWRTRKHTIDCRFYTL